MKIDADNNHDYVRYRLGPEMSRRTIRVTCLIEA